MSVLVAYASRYGATREIAERIAEALRAAGHAAEAQLVRAAGDLAGYDAFVIGSAVYFGHWRKEAAEFIRQNRTLLSGQPVWLFSSGPLGTEPTDAQGRDLHETAEPAEITELREAVKPRDHRVFFGVLDRGKLGFLHRFLASLPASRATWAIDGDFRDWDDIDSWAEGIAQQLGRGQPGHDSTR